MGFSGYLDGQRKNCRELVEELGKSFSYVSILGTDVSASVYRADIKSSLARDGNGECGFVVKMHNNDAFYEYSLNDINGDKKALAKRILEGIGIDEELKGRTITAGDVNDVSLKEDFSRENDHADYTDKDLIDVCHDLSKRLKEADEHVLNAFSIIQTLEVSKLFISKEKELSQVYGWANGILMVVYSDGKTVQARHVEGENDIVKIIEGMYNSTEKVIDLARHLVTAKPIEPGVYDVITDSSITGLIAHEAFGHGVEMDQFVKDRALAKNYMDDYVASEITNMHDGAAATHSVASYFFDDDGVLANDTQIIRNGKLVAGLSDLTSATELGTEPSGNGRRDSYKRKAYSRMTNTFFEAGKDKLEDMIASVKHGYMLFDTNNGMEDPKNWQIQCTAEYGIEIVDGKLTDNYVSPVVMSGYVPDLLKSISMISDEFKVIGSGMCGKGYKEWVRVSDGGPNLKCRVKLG
ncbi:MAG: TldD/PmbA family protein [Clostridia bacterium]|nr:TldD/PmbA family protein [Clostridia bacterium]